eukprot:8273503-Prorocentrum_lima.AAC.1
MSGAERVKQVRALMSESNRVPTPSPFMFGGGGGGHPNNKSVVWKIPPSMPAINDTHSSSGISACVPTSGTERVQLDHKYQSTSVLLDVEEDIGGSSFMRRTISVFLPFTTAM